MAVIDFSPYAVTTGSGRLAGMSDAQEVAGTALNAAQQSAVTDDVAQATALAQAIRACIAQARLQGVAAFAPDSAQFQAPAGWGAAMLAPWFTDVIGHPFSAASTAAGLPAYGDLTLAQWSGAVDALEAHAAQSASRLAPGAGGGPRFAGGAWYVNGERYTLAELFVAVRMGSLASVDATILTDLDTLARNGRLAKDMLGVLMAMKARRAERATQPGLYVDATQPVLNPYDPDADFVQFIKDIGLTASEFRGYGVNLKGTDSVVAKAVDQYADNIARIKPVASQGSRNSAVGNVLTIYTTGANGLGDGTVVRLQGLNPPTLDGLYQVVNADPGKSDYFECKLAGTVLPVPSPNGAGISYTLPSIPGNPDPTNPLDYLSLGEEVQALFDTVNADNAVKRIRVEATQSQRAHVLDGMNAFLSGFFKGNQALARNLKGG